MTPATGAVGAAVEVLTHVVEAEANARRQEAAELEPDAQATADRIAKRAKDCGIYEKKNT